MRVGYIVTLKVTEDGNLPTVSRLDESGGIMSGRAGGRAGAGHYVA